MAAPDAGFRPGGFFVLRTPLQPASRADDLAAGVHEALRTGLDDAGFARALERDRARLQERSASVVDEPCWTDALAISSQGAVEAVTAWREAPGGRKAQKAQQTVVRYALRAATRPTPFGLWAGLSVGAIDSRTALRLPSRDSYRRVTRIDPGWLAELAHGLAGDPRLRALLRYRPNPTLYRVGQRWRYVARRIEDERWTHTLRDVRSLPALCYVIEAATGGVRLDDLARGVLSQGSAEPEAVSKFLTGLVEQQVLVPDLAAPVTGGEPAEELLGRLDGAGHLSELVTMLRELTDELAELDQGGLGASPQRYAQIRERLDHVQSGRPRTLIAELRKPSAELTLGPAVVEELGTAIAALQRWSPPPPDPLAEFRSKFMARYEGREVALVKVLDPDIGIGPEVLEQDERRDRDDDQRARRLFAKLEQTLRDGSGEIVLDDKGSGAASELPNGFAVMARLAARSAEAVDRGEFRLLLQGVQGPNGACLLARFCPGDDELTALVRAQLAEEEALDPDALHAEIAHSFSSRISGVMQRPLLRQAEIDYLGPSGAPRDNVLSIEELLVSVHGDRVLLRSRASGQWIAPTFASALNLRLEMPAVFRFLAMLERQSTRSLSWDWGALGAAPFLPRVVVGRSVLALARWRLDEQELRPLADGSTRQRFAAVRELRSRRQLPARVAFADADNVLPLDLDTTLGVETLLDLLGDRGEARLVEIFPTADELVVEGPEGLFTHELVVPFVSTRRVERPAASGTAPAPPGFVRRFPPGGRWLSAKLYAGAATIDSLIQRRVAPLASKLVREGLAERWFYIRYADPDTHLRLRFDGDPGVLTQRVLPSLHELGASLLEEELIWSMQLDTYEREVERYGGPHGIELFEEWSWLDSEAAAGALELLGAAQDASGARWRLAVVSADLAFEAFGLGLDDRRRAIARARLACAPPRPGCRHDRRKVLCGALRRRLPRAAQAAGLRDHARSRGRCRRYAGTCLVPRDGPTVRQAR